VQGCQVGGTEAVLEGPGGDVKMAVGDGLKTGKGSVGVMLGTTIGVIVGVGEPIAAGVWVGVGLAASNARAVCV
jgi:hypothetical protein